MTHFRRSYTDPTCVTTIREYDFANRAWTGRAVGIERTEYYARQAAARKLAQERGFSALVTWSRGGSTQDHYADVYYLTGIYTHQPFIPGEPGRWRAHGHAALVLSVDGPGTLLLDMTELQDPKPAADRVCFSEDLVESLIATVAETVPPAPTLRWWVARRSPGGGAASSVRASLSIAWSKPTISPRSCASSRARRSSTCFAPPAKLVPERSMLPWRPPFQMPPKQRSRRRPSRRSFARVGHSTGWGSPLARGLTRLAHPPPPLIADDAF